MKNLVPILCLILFAVGCTVEPRPINFGQDECEFCKMKLMDEKFGAQLVTSTGRIYMFDDVNCLAMFLDSEEGERHEYKHKLVVDYSNPGELLDVNYTFFLKSSEIRTPMASEVIALPDEETLDEFKDELGNGIYLGWGEIKNHFK